MGREVFQAAPVAILAVDRRGRIVEANEAASRLVGRPVHELCGSAVADHLPELDDRPRVRSVLLRSDGTRSPVDVRRSVAGDLTVLVVDEASLPFEVDAALHARREMIRAAAESADLTAVLDATGTITSVSAGAFGGLESTIGRPWREFVHPGDLKVVGETLRRLRSEGPGLRSMEIRLQSDEGELTVDALLYVERPDGVATAYVVLMRDITERRMQEEALRRSERQLQDAFEWSSAGLAIGEEGRLVRVNRALCEILGRPEHELLGHDLIEFTHPDDRGLTSAARQTREPIAYEKRYLRPDGSIVWGLVGGAAMRDEDGGILHYVGCIVDITARKQTQEELARRAAQQAAIIELGRTALEGVAVDELFAEALRTATRHLDVELAGLLEVTGHGAELVLRRCIGWDPDPTGTTIPAAASQSGYAMTTGRTVVTHDLAEEDRFRPSALLRDFGVRSGVAAPIHVHGHPAGVLGVHSRSPRRFDEDDVMFVQSIAAVLASAMARERHEEITERAHQQDRLAVVGQMAAGLAHDFNNVLTVVKLHAELLGRADALSDVARRQAATISEQVDRAIALVWQLLDVARRSDIRAEPVDLAAFIDRLVPMVEPSLPSGSRVVVVVEERPSVVLIDVSRLNQIVLNLTSNAADAMPAGGELTLSVVAGADAARPGYVLEVRDDGVGMPPEVERRAFDPFYSTKGPGKGTGLGLAQVRALVDQHEGHVTLHTSPGAGTAVRIWLPSPSGTVEAAVIGAGNQWLRGRQERVLLVEDEVAVAEAVAAQLHDLGYEVVRAANGLEALELLESDDEVAVVLTDLAMPELDGEELVRRLRRDRPGLPVVLTGAHAATDPALRDLDWLQKPYPSERLAQVIGHALAGRR